MYKKYCNVRISNKSVVSKNSIDLMKIKDQTEHLINYMVLGTIQETTDTHSIQDIPSPSKRSNIMIIQIKIEK